MEVLGTPSSLDGSSVDLSSKYSPTLSYIASTSPKYVSKCFIFSILVDVTRTLNLVIQEMVARLIAYPYPTYMSAHRAITLSLRSWSVASSSQLTTTLIGVIFALF